MNLKLNRKIVKEMARNGLKFVEDCSPTILTGLVAAGVLTSVGMAVRATTKALPLIEEEKVRRCKEGLDDHLKPAEVVKVCWKCYVPTVSMAALTVACAIGANKINLQRNAALSSLYSVSSTALKEYEQKVIEQVGPEKNETIKNAVAKDRMDKIQMDESAALGDGNVWVYDTFSGRKWPCNIGKIKQIAGDLDCDMAVSGDWKSLNEFYMEIGLDEIKPGDSLGFDASNLIDLWFSAQLDDNGRPLVVMDYKVMPKIKYKEMF